MTLFLMLFALSSFAADRGKVLVTIDDLPGWYSPEVNLALMASMKAKLGAQIPKIVFFVNSGRVKTTEERDAIGSFAAAGGKLANHGAAHTGYRSLSPEQFRRNIEDGSKALRYFGAASVLPYFRYPDLDYGDTPAKAKKGGEVLKALGLKDLPASIDAGDWAYEREYFTALLKEDYVAALKVRERFVTAFKTSLGEQIAANEKLHGGPFPQIVMFHITHVLADSIEAIFPALAAQGLRLASAAEVLNDRAYAGVKPCPGKAMALWKDLRACSHLSGRK